jgi:aminoglycoside/choline kinase family phosphotransferase
MKKSTEKGLTNLFVEWCKEKPLKIEPLPAQGSYRHYFRIFSEDKTAIGVFNEDLSENIAFLNFSKHFYYNNLPVPEIYGQNLKTHVYLEQDLGDTTLFSFLSDTREKEGFSNRIIKAYEKTISFLPRFQIQAGKSLNYKVCYPRHSFDKQSMLWDLNYFKYYFLKLAQISFDEQKLEDDFLRFTKYLLSAERDFFLYRDFQSRNVMLMERSPYFIDYQGGRKGALQYDVASLLYDAKADIPGDIRLHLLEKYIEEAQKYIRIDKDKFLEFYYGYVFIRLMQALGAYGFRGFYERKTHFLRSVPYSIQNLEYLLNHVKLPVKIPELSRAWNNLIQSTRLRQIGDVELKVTVRIQSFSYKRGIPWDEKGHGGGFVFDCRALTNPGRLSQYISLTGTDDEVISYFKQKKEVKSFLQHVYAIIDQVIENYQKRNFTDLMVSFGCTGGQHRSVFCADQLKRYLKSKYNVNIEVRHRELEMK